MPKIMICGDYAPTSSNETILSDRNTHIETIIGKELANKFSNVDFSVVNVETSLTTSLTPKKKRGQINRSNPECVEFLKKIKTNVAMLANNHVIDNGVTGIIDTINSLHNAGIDCVGIGKTIAESRKPFVYRENGSIVKILNVANNEFNDVTDTYRVNTLDLLDTFDWIMEERKECDYMIVIYHGGIEFYQYPTPMLQRICRKMVDYGADVVTCQHSHCIGSIENYNGSTIIYGQGNFLFDDTDNELEKMAILLEVDTEKKTVEFIPVVKNGSLVRCADIEEQKKIMKSLETRSQMAKTEDLKSMFSAWCDSQEREIYNTCAGYYVPYKVLNKISGRQLEKKVYSSKSKMRLYNMLKSVALLEVFEEIMSRYE